LAALRDQTETKMRAARSTIEASRAGSRIFAAKDAQSLESAIRELFMKNGAREIPTPGGAAPVFEIPGFGPVALLCAAGQRAMSAVTRIGLTSRVSRITERKLLVVNPQPELDPANRDWSQVEDWAATLRVEDLVVLETRVLHRLGRSDAGVQRTAFWSAVVRAAHREDDS
jgi:hypothetical protein